MTRAHPVRYLSRRTQTLWPRAAVAGSHYTAVAAAEAALRAGGHAVDAAVAGTFTLCVCEPQSTSLGADLCAMVHEPGRPVAALNATGPAPRAMTLEALAARGIREKWPGYGAETVSVPGLVRGAEALWRRFGRLPWERLWESALDWAENGIPVTDHVAADWTRAQPRLARDPDSQARYLRNGEALPAGTRLELPDLARTIRTLRDGGADAFYTGAIAAEIARSVQEKGGFIAEDDLAVYAPRWVEPLRVDYRGHTILEMPPNSQGAIVIEALNILDGFGAGGSEVDRIHRQIEAVKIAFADGMRRIADPDAAAVDIGPMLDKDRAADLRRTIDMGRARQPQAAPAGDGHNTAYIAVVDGDGNAVSLINSSKEGFGSGVTAGTTGIMLQRRADAFSLTAGHVNAVAPGKRPFHTILPSLAYRGDELWAVYGTTGGIGQAQNQVQVLQALIDDRVAPQTAVDRPRFSVRENLAVVVEERFGQEILGELERRGHPLRFVDRSTIFGGAHAILREDGWLLPASDPRRDGGVRGF
jgi:gamma-glutamyltranspeptidase/glutathione hydrolase